MPLSRDIPARSPETRNGLAGQVLTGSKPARVGTPAPGLHFVTWVKLVMRAGLFSALAFAAACSAPVTTRASEAPSEVCSVLARDDNASATQAASEKWGVPAPLMLGFMRQESHFRGNVGHPASSAYGYAQAVRGTWNLYRNETGKLEARRDDFSDSMDFIGWYISGTHERTGAPYSNTVKHYLAYSRGPAAVGPASAAAKQNAARVAAYVATYEKDLEMCPLEQPADAQSSGPLAFLIPSG